MLVSLIVLSTVATIVYGGLGEPVEFSSAEKQEFVQAHNEWRILAGATNMRKIKWNDELAKLAQDQASTCYSLSPEKEEYAGFAYVVENIFGGQERPSPRSVVDNWGMEFLEYDLETNTCTKGHSCDSIKQVTTASASDIGCAVALCEHAFAPKYFGTCKYGQTEKAGGAPYEIGTPGSKCQVYGEVVDSDGLCIPKPKTPPPPTPKPTPKCEDKTRVCKLPLISVMCKVSKTFNNNCPKTCGKC